VSERADRILEVLDSGLQASTETGFGTDRAPDACARCQLHAPVKGGDLCEGCRAFLLGDVDDDPAHRAIEEYIYAEFAGRFADVADRAVIGDRHAQHTHAYIVYEVPAMTMDDFAAVIAVFGVAAETIRDLFDGLATAFGEVVRPMAEAIAALLNEPATREALEALRAQAEHALPERHTLTSAAVLDLRATLRPTRDLRATEAPRRPPTPRSRRP